MTTLERGQPYPGALPTEDTIIAEFCRHGHHLLTAMANLTPEEIQVYERPARAGLLYRRGVNDPMPEGRGLSLCSPGPFGSSHATLGIMSGFPGLTAYPLGWLTHLTKVLPKQGSLAISHRVSVLRDPCRLPGQSETTPVFLRANRLPQGCLSAL